MSTKTLVAILTLGILIGTLVLLQPFSDKSGNLILNERPTGGDFSMQSANGEKKLSDYKGKLVLIYFGYTYCPDICPTNLGNISVAYRQLSQAQKDQLQVLFISVDPERDTPERLQQYANYFEADMIGMTSHPEIISEVAKRYGVVYAKVDNPNNGTNYAVDHSAFTYVVDQQGKLQEQLPHATSPQQFIETINKYLKKSKKILD